MRTYTVLIARALAHHRHNHAALTVDRRTRDSASITAQEDGLVETFWHCLCGRPGMRIAQNTRSAPLVRGSAVISDTAPSSEASR